MLATYDVAESLPPVLAEVAEGADVLRRDDVTIELVVVDRGSGDGSADVAVREARRLGLQVDVLEAPDSEGWAAVWSGMQHAVAAPACPDLLITLDPNGHHDARQLPDLVRRHLVRRNGVTIGSRWVRGGAAPGTPLPRRVASRLAGRLVGWFTGAAGVADVTTSFRVVAPEVVELVGDERAAVGSYGFYAEFVAVAKALGFTVDEVPITFRPRYSGVDALTGGDLVAFLRDLPRIRRRVANVGVAMRTDQTAWASRSGRTRRQPAHAGGDFGAFEELETLAGAGTFVDWIVDQFEPHLPGVTGDAPGQEHPLVRVVEVGAGLGAVTRRLVDRNASVQVVALEPAANVVDRLRTGLAGLERVEVRASTSGDWLRGGRSASADVVLYVNVLEHIADDVGELRIARELLRPGGTLGVFVPALPRLYGSLDHKSGHYRRYRRARLEQLARDAGLEVVALHHLDVTGVLPYWFMYRVLDVQRLGHTTSRLYDRVLVPFGRSLERVVGPPPVGKNLVLVARRPTT